MSTNNTSSRPVVEMLDDDNVSFKRPSQAKEILRRLRDVGITRFLLLFRGSKTRSELVATFMAVLELCRLRSVSVGEDENGEPSVTYLKTPDADVQTDIS